MDFIKPIEERTELINRNKKCPSIKSGDIFLLLQNMKLVTLEKSSEKKLVKIMDKNSV